MRFYDGMPPSIFANVSFMRKNGCITSEEAATMKQLISKIRDQRLRNDKAAEKKENIENWGDFK